MEFVFNPSLTRRRNKLELYMTLHQCIMYLREDSRLSDWLLEAHLPNNPREPSFFCVKDVHEAKLRQYIQQGNARLFLRNMFPDRSFKDIIVDVFRPKEARTLLITEHDALDAAVVDAMARMDADPRYGMPVDPRDDLLTLHAIVLAAAHVFVGPQPGDADDDEVDLPVALEQDDADAAAAAAAAAPAPAEVDGVAPAVEGAVPAPAEVDGVAPAVEGAVPAPAEVEGVAPAVEGAVPAPAEVEGVAPAAAPAALDGVGLAPPPPRCGAPAIAGSSGVPPHDLGAGPSDRKRPRLEGGGDVPRATPLADVLRHFLKEELKDVLEQVDARLAEREREEAQALRERLRDRDAELDELRAQLRAAGEESARERAARELAAQAFQARERALAGQLSAYADRFTELQTCTARMVGALQELSVKEAAKASRFAEQELELEQARVEARTHVRSAEALEAELRAKDEQVRRLGEARIRAEAAHQALQEHFNARRGTQLGDQVADLLNEKAELSAQVAVLSAQNAELARQVAAPNDQP